MFTLLPLLCLAGLWGAFMQLPAEASAPAGVRRALLKAAAFFGVLLWAGTELLSLFDALCFEGVALYWGVLAGAVAGFFLSRRGRGWQVRLPRSEFPGSIGTAMLAGIVFLGAVTLLVALVAPPNTWDSMTYHMSRVAHWAQNGAISFYPTHIPRQNHMAPFAEQGILHLYLLWGGDRLANLVQWFSMIGCLAGVSLIAAYLGAGALGQILSAFFAATLPMGVLQASSTQTDYVAALWLVTFAALVLPWLRGEEIERTEWAAVGAALGLAVLTKGTGYLFGAPFVAWVLWKAVRGRERQAVLGLALAGAVALTVNLGHYVRNCRAAGSPLATGQEAGGRFGYRNDAMGPRLWVSNVARNVAIHFGTMSGEVNAACARAVEGLHRALGVDVNDPRTTWGNCEWETVGHSWHEDTAGSPQHVVLIGVCAGLILGARRLREARGLAVYVLCVAGGAALFCALLRWQPWNVRLHLPLLVLSAGFVGPALSGWRRSARVTGVLAAGLLALALWPALRNASRPLFVQPQNVLNVPRIEQYFVNRAALGPPYRGAARYVAERGWRHIGLYCGSDDGEYLLWAAFREAGVAVRIEHVGVSGTERGGASPEVVLSLVPGGPREMTLGDVRYVRTATAGPVTVLRRAGPATWTRQ